jgi:hypothetical protein
MGYGCNFCYNYMDQISIGFACNSGAQPVWHQVVPIEVLYMTHNIICSMARSIEIQRLTRRPYYRATINPYHTYGDFSF